MTAQRGSNRYRYLARQYHSLLNVHGADASVFTTGALSVLLLVVVLFAGVRLLWFPGYSLSGGEMFSVHAVRRDWSSMIAFLVEDVVHPPVYYVLLKVWSEIGGDSVVWLKLFSAVVAIGAICPFYLLCRALTLGAAEINLALVLMGVNGYLIYNAQRLRMYSLLLFLTLCSLWLFVRFFNSEVGAKKPLLALFAVNLLFIGTHYYSWAVIGTELIFLLFWKREKLLGFGKSVAILILCFSPWAYVVASAAMRKGLGPNLSWIPRPNLSSVIGYYSILNGPFDFPGIAPVGLLLFGFPIALWGWHVLKNRQGEDEGRASSFWWLSMLSFLPVALAFFASRILPQSIFHSRYLIIAAVPYMILVAIGIYRLHSYWVRTTTMLLVLGWAALSGITELNKLSRAKEGVSRDRAAWETLIRHLIQTENPRATDVNVYAYGWAAAGPVRFYLESANDPRFQVVLFNDITVLKGDHFWIVFREDRKMHERSLHELLMDKGYQVGERFEAAGDDKRILFPVSRQ
jgi:uncharacterized membrane protein